MKRLLSIVLVLLCEAAMAQMFDSDYYYPYAEPEERTEDPHSDSLLFYRAIRSSDDLYGRTTDYNLPRVTIRRRGASYDEEQATLLGVRLPYRLFAPLRAVGGVERYDAGIRPGVSTLGGVGGVREFTLTEALPLAPYEASVRVTDRNYRVAGRVRMHRMWRDWQVGAVVDGRVGRDARIEGVFTNQLTFAARISRTWASGVELTLFGVLPVAMRGLRSAATEEAYTLLDDPFYNPSWGFQEGKVRNARVRREVMPFGVAGLKIPLADHTHLMLSAGGEISLRKQSGLGWYNARTPLPDNYRYMPSYTGDRASEEAWRMADPRYTQVRWDELIAQNQLGDGEAIYALEDRVSRSLHLTAQALFESRLGEVELRYGVRAEVRPTRNYKQMNDLLGAAYLTDIDQYLVDDDTYGNRLQNDMRNPSRKIREGAIFGYDYALKEAQAVGFFSAAWQRDRLYAQLAAEVGMAVMVREGFYEKELFAGNRSLGHSRRITLKPYRMKAVAGWSFSPRHYLQGVVALGAELPDIEAMFVQPQYNNRTIDNPCLRRFGAADLRYRQTGEKWDAELAAFATLTVDEVETRRYFDDLSGLYADLSVTGIGTLAYGVEGAVTWRPAYRWTVSAAASWGSYRYVRDPRVTVLADRDNAPIEVGGVSHMRDCRVGGAPEVTAVVAVRYYGPRGWGFRLSAGYAGNRYVDAAALRRTDRVAYQYGTTPEVFDAFTRQEGLPDAATLDLSLFKSIYFERSSLLLALYLNNLTGREQISYGYESLRSQRFGTDTGALRMPQATRYLYTQPRTISLNVSWRF